ncbi:putative ribonuclease H-like domain-containing protein [Tanacetum coccineum]
MIEHIVRDFCEAFVDLKLAIKQDLGFIPSGNVVLSSTYVGKILGADQLLVILCYRYQESGIGYWILSMTISGSGVSTMRLGEVDKRDRRSLKFICACLAMYERLISWQCKKQTIMATSTTEAEYVAAASCCGQNPVYHSKTKHIAIRHHFIRDAYEKKLIQVLKIHTDDNVADLLTKAFDVSRGLIEFRESLRRVTDGTEALLIPTLFILWLDKVSTDSAKLVPLGKVCTAIETLKKNTAKALISLLTTITLSTTMAVLDSCPKHNMVAYLEKSEGNAEFHEIIDFLKRSSIHHALTDEGAPSERPSEAQPTPSPAPTSEVPNEPQDVNLLLKTSDFGFPDQAKEIQHLKAQIKKLKNQAKPVIKHHRAWLQSVSLKQRLARKRSSKKQRVHKESVSKQERKFAKGEPSVQRDPLFDEIPEDTVDHMETENA